MIISVLALLYLTVIATVLFTGFIIFYAGYIYYIHRVYAHLPGPKRTSFFFGNAIEFGQAFMSGDNHYEQFLKWYKMYGSIFVVYIIHRVEVVVLEPQSIKDLIVTGNHPKTKWVYDRMAYIYGERYMGNGLVSQTSHQDWYLSRKLMNPAFKKSFLKNLVDQYNECADSLVERLNSLADRHTSVPLMDEFYRVTLDFVARLGFGLDLGCVKNPDAPFCKAMRKTLAGIHTSHMEILPKVNVLKWKFQKEVREACKYMRKLGQECILKRIGDKNIGKETPKDVLTYILHASNGLSHHKFQMEDMLDNFITLFLAGHETTANLLTFTIMELCKNPEIFQKLRDEIESVTGDKQFVETKDLEKLQYMSQVLKESLRLYPPAAALIRTLSHDVVYTGRAPDGALHQYNIPAGTDCSTIMYTMARIEEYFPDAEQFNPDRFSKNPEKSIPLYAYFPFAMGGRSCIGRDFAMFEAKTILIKLLQNFDFELSPDQTFELYNEISLKLKDGCKTFISKRKQKTI